MATQGGSKAVEARVGILGCGGRMGRMLIAQVRATPGARVAGGTDAPGSASIGKDLGTLAGIEALQVTVQDDPVSLFTQCDTVIDFTTPAASAAHAGLAAQARVALVIGTTGLGPDHRAAVERAAKHVPIVQSGNMSLGVTLLAVLVEEAARRLDADYDIEIVEMHHRHKVDAPSGTALLLGEAAARGRQVALQGVSQRVRDGHTGPRRRGDIGFASLRGGDVVGDHSVVFAADGERVELAHKASSRTVFARGAVRAALWAQGQKPGLYGMRDVLGI